MLKFLYYSIPYLGVPGFAAAMIRHLHSLRRMQRDHGWIHTLLGMISHKKSLITIFGHNHEYKNFIKKFNNFHGKMSTAFGFWFIFEIKLLVLK